LNSPLRLMTPIPRAVTSALGDWRPSIDHRLVAQHAPCNRAPFDLPTAPGFRRWLPPLLQNLRPELAGALSPRFERELPTACYRRCRRSS
jgi:hypothetical protein